MFRPRVSLGPRLIAQTHRNPHLQLHRYLYLKVVSGIVLLIAGIFGLGKWHPVRSSSSTLPQTPAVLGVEKKNPQPATFHYLYEIAPHDSLFSISEKFQIAWDTIVALNGLKEPYILVPGQQLKLPVNEAIKQQQFYDNLKNKIYVVSEGDSFVHIAQKLKVSVNQLLQVNPQLKSPETLTPGQRLNVP